MDLGARLKEERLRLGYSQTAFAQLVGAGKHALINWEKGDAFPNAAALAEWSKIGMDVLYVVTGQRSQALSPTADLSHRAQALLDNYEHTDEEGKKVIEATATLAAKQKRKSA